MRDIDEKRHMLETMKQDYDINVGLERAADKHIKQISAELSAFFVAHEKDDHIDTSILRKSPTIHDLTQLKTLAKELSKINEINVKKRKMMYLSMGTTDMELYLQSLMGLMMLPMANNAFQLMEKTLLYEFRDEYQRQLDDLGIDKPLSTAKMQELSHQAFDNKKPVNAFWQSFDKILANLSIELIKAVQQGVSAKDWAKIVGGR